MVKALKFLAGGKSGYNDPKVCRNRVTSFLPTEPQTIFILASRSLDDGIKSLACIHINGLTSFVLTPFINAMDSRPPKRTLTPDSLLPPETPARV